MKRKISLVIAFALSFLLMFSPIAKAEETKLPIQVCTSESAELEIVNKVPSAKMNKAVDSPPQEKTSDRILEGEKQINKTENKIMSRGPCGECYVGGVPGKVWKVWNNGSIYNYCGECFQ
jgi:hypothetical protein